MSEASTTVPITAGVPVPLQGIAEEQERRKAEASYSLLLRRDVCRLRTFAVTRCTAFSFFCSKVGRVRDNNNCSRIVPKPRCVTRPISQRFARNIDGWQRGDIGVGRSAKIRLFISARPHTYARADGAALKCRLEFVEQTLSMSSNADNPHCHQGCVFTKL